MDINELNAALEDIEGQTSPQDRRDALMKTMRAYHGPDEVVPASEIAKRMGDMPAVYSTGYPLYDNFIRGYGPGKLHIVSGHTGQGKTLFCQNITARITDEHPVLWLSYEMDPREIAERFNEGWGTLPNFFLPLHYVHNDIVWVERKIVEGVAKYKTDTVFIDHTHFIISAQPGDRADLVYGNAILALKMMARKYEINIVLMHHVSQGDPTKPPDMHDLRDTSLAGQNADSVTFTFRKTKKQTPKEIREHGPQNTDYMLVLVRKVRQGGRTGNFTLKHDNYQLNEIVDEQGAAGGPGQGVDFGSKGAQQRPKDIPF